MVSMMLTREGGSLEGRAARSQLERNVLFREAAVAIDNGWRRLEAKAEYLDRTIAELSSQVPGDPDNSEFMRAFIEGDDGFDLVEAARARVRATEERATFATIRSLVDLGNAAVSNAASAWILANEAALCARIQDARLTLQAKLKELLPALDGVHSAADLEQHPEAAGAFASARALLTEWESWAKVHRNVIPYQQPVFAQGQNLTGAPVWPGLLWVANYTTAWPSWFDRLSSDERPPWDLDAPIDQARAIAHFECWTPTSHYLHKIEPLFRSPDVARREYERQAKANGENDPARRRPVTIRPGEHERVRRRTADL